MRVTPDTNVLLRVIVRDDEPQARAALHLLANAETVAVPLPSLCEVVWVLDRGYGYTRQQILSALDVLLAAANVVVDRPAVDAGLAVLRDGGDFADGLIAHEGNWLGGDTFVSFDKKAVAVLMKLGRSARLVT